MTQPNIGTGEGCPIEERIAILSKVRTDELRNLVALLRRKHAEWSQLPQLDNNDDRANEHLPPDLKKLWDDTNACEKDPVARHFNMNYWQIDIRHDCGFSGCAIGTLLTFDKDASNRLGLILEKQNYIPNPNFVDADSDSFVAVPMKSGNVGFRAMGSWLCPSCLAKHKESAATRRWLEEEHVI